MTRCPWCERELLTHEDDAELDEDNYYCDYCVHIFHISYIRAHAPQEDHHDE